MKSLVLSLSEGPGILNPLKMLLFRLVFLPPLLVRVVLYRRARHNQQVQSLDVDRRLARIQIKPGNLQFSNNFNKLLDSFDIVK